MTLPAIAGPDVPTGSDDALVARARRGDRGAEYALFRRHVERVHRLIYRLCGDADVADDCTQETFVKAFQELHRFRGDSSFSTWLHRIAVNVTLNAERTRTRRARWTQPARDDDPAPSVPEGDPHLARALEQALASLTEGQRTVFLLYEMEGYTHPEIGELLGISDGTSKTRLFHARVKLRELLARFAPETSS